MKKFFAIVAVMGMMTFGITQNMVAQEPEAAAEPAAAEQVEEAAAPAVEEVAEEAPVVEENASLHKELKTKFIEGGADFMSLVAIALVLGLAFCIERIIYLSLAEVNTKKLMKDIEAKLANNDIAGAKQVA